MLGKTKVDELDVELVEWNYADVLEKLIHSFLFPLQVRLHVLQVSCFFLRFELFQVQDDVLDVDVSVSDFLLAHFSQTLGHLVKYLLALGLVEWLLLSHFVEQRPKVAGIAIVSDNDLVITKADGLLEQINAVRELRHSPQYVDLPLKLLSSLPALRFVLEVGSLHML